MEANLKKLIENTNFEKLFKELGYKFYTNGDYNVNVIGVRNLLDGNIQTNKFNDAMLLIFKINGVWHKYVWEATTDPGLSYL